MVLRAASPAVQVAGEARLDELATATGGIPSNSNIGIKAEEAGDEVARTAWSRTCEHAKKLALIYACSENHQDPVIRLPAVEWATEFAMHQTRRQLYLASVHVAENPFHAECLKFVKTLKEHPDRQMQRQHLLKYMKCKAADFDQIVLTLLQQEEIEPVAISTKTKPATGYRLTEEILL